MKEYAITLIGGSVKKIEADRYEVNTELAHVNFFDVDGTMISSIVPHVWLFVEPWDDNIHADKLLNKEEEKPSRIINLNAN